MSECESTAFVLGFVWWKYWKMKTYFVCLTKLLRLRSGGRGDGRGGGEKVHKQRPCHYLQIFQYF